MSLTERQRETFLMHFAENGQKKAAAEIAGAPLSHFNDLIRGDIEFAAMFEEAYQSFRDLLEAEIQRRGVKGVPKHIFHQGIAVRDPNNAEKPYTELQYSDSMLALLAKRHIPEYSDKSTGEGEKAVKVMVVPGGLSADDWAAKYDGLAAAQQKAKDDADNEAKE